MKCFLSALALAVLAWTAPADAQPRGQLRELVPAPGSAIPPGEHHEYCATDGSSSSSSSSSGGLPPGVGGYEIRRDCARGTYTATPLPPLSPEEERAPLTADMYPDEEPGSPQ